MKYRTGSNDFFSAIIANVATAKPSAEYGEIRVVAYWIDTDKGLSLKAPTVANLPCYQRSSFSQICM